MPELRASSLETLAATSVDGVPVEVPRYERTISQRICHIGPGRFHRAHQAEHLHRLLQQGAAPGWGICGIGLRAADRPTLAALDAQDGLYSLWELSGDERKVQVIGSLMERVDASADDSPAIRRIADPATRIVSLTVTEPGYCLDARGELDLAHPDIVYDLDPFHSARSAPGLLVRGLAARRAVGGAGLTLMSCDNLIGNGQRLRDAVLGIAAEIDTGLAGWIRDHARFPSSMVDRITPAADPVVTERLCDDWGVRDEALVNCETWRQWVMEDDFASGRPPLEQAGVVFTRDVHAYEDAKVGLLNGSHSALCHAALLAGHVFVHHALAVPGLKRWVRAYMSEVAQTLKAPPGLDLDAYQASLLARFANPAIADRLLRLAQDTTAKFRQVLLPVIRRRLQARAEPACVTAALAAWIAWLDSLRGDAKARAGYLDANRDHLVELAASACARGDAVPFLADVLPEACLADVPARVTAHLRAIRKRGAVAYLSKLTR